MCGKAVVAGTCKARGSYNIGQKRNKNKEENLSLLAHP